MQSRTLPIPQDLEYQETHIKDSKVPQLIATGVLCLVIAYAAVILRFCARRLGRTPLKADDYMILTTLYCVLLLALTHQSFGRHAILAKNPRLAVVLGLALEITYSVTLPVIKVSTLLFLHRILGFPDKQFARRLLVAAIVIIAYSVAQIVCLSIQCVPLSVIWNTSTTIEGKCIQIRPAFLVCGTMNVLTNLAIFALPIPKLWGLQINSKQRFQLICIFLVGGVVCIISIVRIPKLFEYSLTDITWHDVDFAIWSGFELAIATVSACVPTMRPLLDCVFAKTRGIGSPQSPAEQHSPTWRPEGGTQRSSFLRICEEESWTRQVRGTTTVRSEGSRDSREMQRPSSELEPPGLWSDGIKMMWVE